MKLLKAILLSGLTSIQVSGMHLNPTAINEPTTTMQLHSCLSTIKENFPIHIDIDCQVEVFKWLKLQDIRNLMIGLSSMAEKKCGDDRTNKGLTHAIIRNSASFTPPDMTHQEILRVLESYPLLCARAITEEHLTTITEKDLERNLGLGSYNWKHLKPTLNPALVKFFTNNISTIESQIMFDHLVKMPVKNDILTHLFTHLKGEAKEHCLEQALKTSDSKENVWLFFKSMELQAQKEFMKDYLVNFHKLRLFKNNMRSLALLPQLQQETKKLEGDLQWLDSFMNNPQECLSGDLRTSQKKFGLIMLLQHAFKGLPHLNWALEMLLNLDPYQGVKVALALARDVTLNLENRIFAAETCLTLDPLVEPFLELQSLLEELKDPLQSQELHSAINQVFSSFKVTGKEVLLLAVTDFFNTLKSAEFKNTCASHQERLAPLKERLEKTLPKLATLSKEEQKDTAEKFDYYLYLTNKNEEEKNIADFIKMAKIAFLFTPDSAELALASYITRKNAYDELRLSAADALYTLNLLSSAKKGYSDIIGNTSLWGGIHVAAASKIADMDPMGKTFDELDSLLKDFQDSNLSGNSPWRTHGLLSFLPSHDSSPEITHKKLLEAAENLYNYIENINIETTSDISYQKQESFKERSKKIVSKLRASSIEEKNETNEKFSLYWLFLERVVGYHETGDNSYDKLYGPSPLSNIIRKAEISFYLGDYPPTNALLNLASHTRIDKKIRNRALKTLERFGKHEEAQKARTAIKSSIR